ncbi:MAG: T9SS type A sorting domain-containing protein [Ignavibacteria bacterium]|nr:T9SS type A sorting domain-containing protein [Ignavibacteria bacterium]
MPKLKFRFVFYITAMLIVYSATTAIAQQYVIENTITGMQLPVSFAFLPNNNVIVTLKQSSAKIYNTNNTEISTFWNFADSLNSQTEQGVLGVTLDPLYSSNRYIYIYYVHSFPPNSQSNHRLRVVRFTENNNTGTNPFIVFDYLAGTIGGNHVGGNLNIGRDGKLYITIGETGVQSNAQLLTNPRGKILRLNPDGTIPSDNPFYDDGNPVSGNDDRIWVYGLRNSFDFCISPFNDSIYATENGPTDNDEINFIRKGKNYGWPVCSGYCTPFNPAYRQPMTIFSSPLLPALTGIIIYNGSLMPELNNKIIAASSNTHVNGYIYRCDPGNAPFYDTIVSKSQLADLRGISDLAQGPDGNIYALGILSGILYKIGPNTSSVQENSLPLGFLLEQNYPNPFNPVTKINFSIYPQESGIKPQIVKLSVFDVLGKESAVLVNSVLRPGNYSVEWNAAGFPCGVYFCSLSTGEKSLQKKMVLIK